MPCFPSFFFCAHKQDLNQTLEHRHIVDGCVHVYCLPAFEGFPCGGQFPRAVGKVDITVPFVQMQDRRDEETAAEHILVFRLPALIVIWKLIEHGAQKRGTVLVCFLIQFSDIVVQ